jgi:spermidine synthase
MKHRPIYSDAITRADPETAAVRVRIGEDGGRAALLVDGVVQSISPEDGLAGGGYWAAMVPDDPPRNALILGLGGGTIARLVRTRWGEVPIVGVDDDAEIVETAGRVGWLPSNGLELVMADAFEYVQTCERRFDFIAVDLFRGQRLAARAFGRPFLRGVRALLEPRGRLAMNMFFDKLARQRETRIASMFDISTINRIGGNVVIHARRRRR